MAQNNDRLDKVILEARRAADRRDAGYRAQALKLYPWVCGRCAPYCHEHEHSKVKDSAGRTGVADALPVATFNPFADLKAKLDAKRQR